MNILCDNSCGDAIYIHAVIHIAIIHFSNSEQRQPVNIIHLIITSFGFLKTIAKHKDICGNIIEFVAFFIVCS